jgi:porin
MLMISCRQYTPAMAMHPHQTNRAKVPSKIGRAEMPCLGRDYRSIWSQCLYAASAGLLCLVIGVSGANSAAADPFAAPSNHAHKSKKVPKAARIGPTGPVYKGPATVAVSPAIPPCSQESAAALNPRYGLKGWDIPFPNFGDSLLLDYGCWRTNLAKAGFGFSAYNVDLLIANTVNHYTPSSGHQQYAGQRPTGLNSLNFFLTYDLSQYGIPDGQLAFGGIKQNTTYINYTQNAFNMIELSYYQTALDKKLEFEIGYTNLAVRFQGTQLGGNIANPLGSGSATAALLGANNAPETTPAAIVKWNMTDRLYDKFAIARSTPGTAQGGLGSSLLVEHYFNPTGFTFSGKPCIFGTCYPAPRELFLNEFGYRNQAAPGDPSTWVRADFFYNNTPYNNLQYSTAAAPTYTDNRGFQFLIDRQIWQSEPDSPFTAYKGVYLGTTLGHVIPQAAALPWDFQGRIYTYGLFGRPRDQLAFNFEHEIYSPYIVDPSNNAAPAAGPAAALACVNGGLCRRHAVNIYTLSYNANIMRGVFATIGVQYVDHPSLVWSPLGATSGSAAIPASAGLLANYSQFNINHSLNLLASIFTVF